MTDAPMRMVDEFIADFIALSDENPPSTSLSNPRNVLIKDFLMLRFHAKEFMPEICQRASCNDLKPISELKTADDLMAIKASSRAIISLGLIGHANESRKKECISSLCRCLENAHPILVGLAISTLRKLDALELPTVREKTGLLIDSSDTKVREKSAIALCEEKDSRAVPITIDLLHDVDSDVCDRAKAALIKYKGSGFLFGSSNAGKWKKWWESTPESQDS